MVLGIALLLVLALSIGFGGVGRGIAEMSALRRGSLVPALLHASSEIGPTFVNRSLMWRRYRYRLADGAERELRRIEIAPIVAQAPDQVEVLAVPEPPFYAISVRQLPSSVHLDAREQVIAVRSWLGLPALIIPAAVVIQNRFFLLQDASVRARVVAAVALLLFGLVPAVMGILLSTTRSISGSRSRGS